MSANSDLSEEFESYRKILRTEEDKQAFDRNIKQLLQERGVNYVRGYVDGLKDNISKWISHTRARTLQTLPHHSRA